VKKYKVNYITWGHNAPEATYDLVPPDQSGPWTLESHDAVPITLPKGDLPTLLHSYVWSQDTEPSVYVKLPSQFWGIDVLARLHMLDGLQERNKSLMEANTKLQDSLAVVIHERDESLTNYKALEKDAERYRTLADELRNDRDVAFKRSKVVEQELQTLIENPLGSIQLGPSHRNNMFVNSVLKRVWKQGLVSHTVGKEEFLSVFYGTPRLAEVAETARMLPDPLTRQFNGSDRIKFLEKQLAQANSARRSSEGENASLRERLDKLNTTLLDTEQRLNTLAQKLTTNRTEPF
jgi:vacuolar-type H+-ATPase subunit I/STV1